MSDLAEIVARAGIVDPVQLQEFVHWRLPVPSDAPVPSLTLPALLEAIERAITSAGFVLMKETDLEAVKTFLTTQQMGLLAVDVDGETGVFPVSYGVLPTGEYLIPWNSESIQEHMTNYDTKLTTPDGNFVRFKSVRELYFSNTKAFMACMPR